MELGLSAVVSILRKDFAAYCDKRLQELGLAPGLLYFVIYLGKHPGSSPGRLASALGADSGHTARSVEKLARSGFLVREQNPRDKRAFQLTLTPRGEEAFREIRDLFRQWDEAVMKDLSRGEREELLRLLGKLAASGAWVAPAPGPAAAGPCKEEKK